MRKIKTIAEKIDEMVTSYEKLNLEAHQLIDLYIDAMRLEYPDTPISVLKQMLITAQAGAALNVPRALQILKERKTAARRLAYHA
jgi:hypothetical protein